MFDQGPGTFELGVDCARFKVLLTLVIRATDAVGSVLTSVEHEPEPDGGVRFTQNHGNDFPLIV